MSNLSKRLLESFDTIGEEILGEERLDEARTQLWQDAYNSAVGAEIPEDQAELFIEYIWQKASGMTGLRIPAKVKQYLQNELDSGAELPEQVIHRRRQFQDGQYVPTGEVSIRDNINKTEFSSLPSDVIKIWYDLIFAPIYNHENTTGVRKKTDLEQYLMKAREVVASVVGRDYMAENDTRPKIRFGETDEHVLAYHSDRDNCITLSSAFKSNEDLIDDYAMNTLIHEFIHSLRSCNPKKLERTYKAGNGEKPSYQDIAHSGEWKRVADLITEKTSHTISRYAQSQESKAFHAALDKLKTRG